MGKIFTPPLLKTADQIVQIEPIVSEERVCCRRGCCLHANVDVIEEAIYLCLLGGRRQDFLGGWGRGIGLGLWLFGFLYMELALNIVEKAIETVIKKTNTISQKI